MSCVSDIGIALIGSGFMGRSHALALAAAGRTFELPARARLEILADVTAEAAALAAHRLGFARATGDWREAVSDTRVNAVHITVPNELHEPIAMAAIAAGKAVHCEKPLSLDAASANALADAAEQAGVVTAVGFNYLKNPLQSLARDLVADGEIGEPIAFHGVHAEDYMLDPSLPFTWRHARGGGGAAMDLGSHICSLARFLLGDLTRVMGQHHTVIARRADSAGREHPVTIDDQCHALVEFGNGATGTLQASWVAAGSTMRLAYEIVGTRGAIRFDQERFNELSLYRAGPSRRRAGFTTITSGPEHAPYDAFCPAPGHQLGFNDLKTIEMRDFLVAVAGGTPAMPDFREAARVQDIVDAIAHSAASREWVEIPSL